MIVSVALQYATDSEIPVAVIAEDTDILAMLIHHRQQQMCDILFVSESKRGRGSKVIPGKCISVSALQKKLDGACSRILVAHAIGGCDTTSAIFGFGKGKIFNKLNDDKTLHSHCVTLLSESATADDVGMSGVRILTSLYGGKDSESLGELRYKAFCNTSLSRRFMAERLPPSESAARLHAKRAHLQVVIWASLGKTSLAPTDWGWSLTCGKLAPITLDGPVAPDHVLNVIRCKCKGDCSSAACSCKKHGLSCVTACTNCNTTKCSNMTSDHISNTDDSFHDNDSEPEADTTPEDLFPDDIPQSFLDADNHYELYEEEV